MNAIVNIDLTDSYSIYFRTAKIRGRWFRGLLGTTFWITLRGISGFCVTPGLLVPSHPHLVSDLCSFKFTMFLNIGFNIFGRIVLWCKLGGVL